jgi:BirA family biotin operon repressor/biotin-[acetyl-CoA-carboxylase] ligase
MDRAGPLPLYSYDELDSTQDEAERLSRRLKVRGFVVFARRQISGRGRRGRAWVSGEGGLWLTVALRQDEMRCNPGIVTYAAAVGLHQSLERLGVKAEILWPNDIFVGGAKLCGILVESDSVGNRFGFVRVGVGLNVTNDVTSIDAPYPVTNLSACLGRNVDVMDVLEVVIRGLLDALMSLPPERVLQEYRKRSGTLGKRVQIISSGSVLEGVAEDVDEEGRLVLTSGKSKLVVESGELVWRSRNK